MNIHELYRPYLIVVGKSSDAYIKTQLKQEEIPNFPIIENVTIKGFKSVPFSENLWIICYLG